MRKLLFLAVGLLAFWNLQAVGDVKEAVVELLIVGKIPGTEVYLSLTATFVILALLILMLIQWARSLMSDFVEFSLELHRQEEAQRLAAAHAAAALEPESQVLTPFSEGLSEEELDLMSV
ncbi:MAG: hypothetical protein R3313_04390 [Candidatus Saccharimonadales bacterium]|nr:hypothetical protein [Candidatus Saccharimonadales bacterium]